MKHLKNRKNNSQFIVIVSDFELRFSFLSLFPNEGKNIDKHKQIKIISLMFQHRLKKEFNNSNVKVWRDNNVADKFTIRGSHYNFLVSTKIEKHKVKKILESFEIPTFSKRK